MKDLNLDRKNLEHDTINASSAPESSESPGSRLVSNLKREHELTKAAKELCIGLPIREDSARAIVSRIGSHPLALAAFGSWIEALQEAIEDSVASVGFGTEPGTSEAIVVRTLTERLKELSRQADEITLRLSTGGRPPERHLMGASQFEHAPHEAQHPGASSQAKAAPSPDL